MRSVLATGLAFLCLVQPSPADEGYWLFTDPPRRQLLERHQFEPNQAWLDRLRDATVKLGNGSTGAFVSGQGLVVTAQHSIHDFLPRAALEQGFVARSRAEELRLPGLELLELVAVEDVTEKVRGAADDRARQELIGKLVAEQAARSGWAEVAPLYHGARFHLYGYRVYDDVRLVFAPEWELAFFGGDEDNFEFPRYSLDVAMVRAYRDGQPAQPRTHLAWSQAGAREGELVLTAAHPAHSERLITSAHLAFRRDVQYPLTLEFIRRLELVLRTYADEEEQHAGEVRDELASVQSARKVYEATLDRLNDPSLLAARRELEEKIRQTLTDDGAWRRIQETAAALPDLYRRYYLLEAGRAFHSPLFGHARTLVRITQNPPGPGELRQELERSLMAPDPLPPKLEAAQLADSLSFLVEVLGIEDPVVQTILAGQSPRERAAALADGTRLGDPAFRKQLLAGGAAAVRDSRDPMIQLALAVEPEASRLHRLFEEEAVRSADQAYRDLATQVVSSAARTVLDYPDASGTLRLSFGVVRGYTDEAGDSVPAATTLGGLLQRSRQEGNQEPFRLSPAWTAANLTASTPLDFVSTLDVTEGSAGAPVVDREGRVVGVLFDGNHDSIGHDFLYTEERARAIAVDSRAVLEALGKVYRAETLVSELKTSGD